MGAHMTPDDHNQIWDLVEAGESYASIGSADRERVNWAKRTVDMRCSVAATATATADPGLSGFRCFWSVSRW